jgi:hypothetical protein
VGRRVPSRVSYFRITLENKIKQTDILTKSLDFGLIILYPASQNTLQPAAEMKGENNHGEAVQP